MYQKIGVCIFMLGTIPIGVANAEGTDKVAQEEEIVDVVEEVEAVEVVEEVAVVEVGNSDDGDNEKGLSLFHIIGRNHAAAVHLPIGLIMGVLLLELLALFFPKLPLGKSSLILSIAVVASFVPASISGWLRSQEVYAESVPPELFFEHRNLVLVSVMVFVLSLGLRLLKKDNLEGKVRWVYLGMLSISVLLLAAGGHHGGQLVYGENFLPY